MFHVFLNSNVISVTSKATVNNLSVLSKERYSKKILTNDSIAVQAVRHGDLYYAYPRIKRTAIAWVSDFVKWHFKLVHLNKSDLKIFKSKNMVRNIIFNDDESLKDCKIPKSKVNKFPKEFPRNFLMHKNLSFMRY